MSFFQSADAYDRFMGRYSAILTPRFADFAGVADGMRVLDVGCGPGILTTELVARVGAGQVVAVDPSAPFVEAVHARTPGVDARVGTAEDLPYPDGSFDAALAQLVVHFMNDPVAGVRQMARVTRPAGTVAACVWDLAGDRAPLSPFWAAARAVDPGQSGESDRRGTSAADLTAIFVEAGVTDVETVELAVPAEHASFDEWWQPFEAGVGPTGAYIASLPPQKREAIRAEAQKRVPDGPHTVTWYAWAARGSV